MVPVRGDARPLVLLVLEGIPLRPHRHAPGNGHRPDRRDHSRLRREGHGPGRRKGDERPDRPRERPGHHRLPAGDRAVLCALRPEGRAHPDGDPVRRHRRQRLRLRSAVLRLEHGRGDLLQLAHQVHRLQFAQAEGDHGRPGEDVEAQPAHQGGPDRLQPLRLVAGDTVEDILKIDKAALKRYDVDPAYLYFALQTMIQGTFGQPARIRTGGKDIVVSVKYPDAATLDMRGLGEALVRTRGGEYLRLGEIAAFAEAPIPGSIDREDQQFQQTIMWEFRGPAKAEERYRKAVFDSLHLAPGFAASLEEDWFVTEEEQEQINFAIAVALVLIFMILAALYESFVTPFFILLAVPLALIGVFVAFVVAKAPFDPTAYIGVILLSGIVVNNAILLVDHINLRRRQGLGLLEAVVRGTKDRVRPILMTTATTVFGMLPLLLIGAEANKRQIWSSLALCTVGGLTTSTLLILFVIPVLYFHGDGLRAWGAEKAREARGLFGKKAS
ncbi:MAG: efflux RND transporter permease subunit [Marinilabiliales bacterium]|nr:efflux RND transporter permease subunit [Marinilabiliales bacterium]